LVSLSGALNNAGWSSSFRDLSWCFYRTFVRNFVVVTAWGSSWLPAMCCHLVVVATVAP
jgi:hypothetical protein